MSVLEGISLLATARESIDSGASQHLNRLTDKRERLMFAGVESIDEHRHYGGGNGALVTTRLAHHRASGIYQPNRVVLGSETLPAGDIVDHGQIGCLGPRFGLAVFQDPGLTVSGLGRESDHKLPRFARRD
jgi:hypothetical protein